MIPTVKEPEDMYRETRVYEKCFFCDTSTDTWHWRTNQPVCIECAKIHKVKELPKCTPDYKPKTKAECLKTN